MEISGNSINQPVNFYPKNTGNTINMAIEGENHLYQSNIFAPEFVAMQNKKNVTIPIRKKRKSKRLNTMDTDYLPDETVEETEREKADNFFITEERKPIKENFKKTVEHFLTTTPLINYFFLKSKHNRIQKTVETLSDISQNVDELLNSAVPYGEEKTVYQDIARNLTDAANLLGKANKEL